MIFIVYIILRVNYIMPVKMKRTYSKNKNKQRKKTAKRKHIKVLKNLKNRNTKKKNNKSHKNRLYLKNIPKKQLAKTLRKARRKIQKQLKKLYFKGGSKGGSISRTELPQYAGQNTDSLQALGSAMLVKQQAGVLNQLEPSIV
jgi:hypothetical protein